MCGIAGILQPGQERSPADLEALAGRMADAIAHRGPDARGIYVDSEARVALGHRRLSIIDLSPLGAQPMTSEDGRFVLSFNGEIYNYQELSAELASRGHRFRGSSDTEVMLAAFLEWGIEGALARFNGMFAFALYDTTTRSLFLARDRLGEKPLFYGWAGRSLVFGSELKALWQHDELPNAIDRAALMLYFRYNCVPSPWSIFERIRKLPPATFIRFSATGDVGAMPEPIEYWSAREEAERGYADPHRGSAHEIVEELRTLLLDAVKIRMHADVPLGAFLSGGIDSTTIVALMQAQSVRPIKTFTIGFGEADANEAPFAKRIAEHLGTEHTEQYVTTSDALEVIPKLPAMYDEPFSDSSQIPTHLCAALARRHVTVSLSGDGGDELFAGYHRHFWQLWERLGPIPPPLRTFAARHVLRHAYEGPAGRALGRASRALTHMNVRDKLFKLGGVLEGSSVESMYHAMCSHWRTPEELVVGHGAHEALSNATDPSKHSRLIASPTRRIMALDAITYLPDDILVKLDRATMAVSLEGRVPYLDHRVYALAARIPLAMNLKHARGKWMLREILASYVPREMFERPKQGFSIPLFQWLKGHLRPWAESLLDEHRLREDGYLDPVPIHRLWREYLEGSGEWQFAIWDVLMFQAWLASRKPERAEVAAIPEVRERPKRILHVFGPLNRGGAELRTLDLMRNLDRSRYAFEFLALSDDAGSLVDEIDAMGGRVHAMKVDARFPFAFRKLLREREYDVVHSHVYLSSGFVLRLAAMEGVPVRIAHFRSTTDSPSDSAIRRVRRAVLKRWVDRYATSILAVSRAAMTASWGPGWENDPRCRVLYNGLDMHRANGAAHANGSRSNGGAHANGEARRGPLLVHLASLNRCKNQVRLVEIFAKLQRAMPGARLMFAGADRDGSRALIEEAIARHDLASSVTLLGEQSDPSALLASADLMVFPSLWEGLPGAVLEAAAVGTPVLASDIPSIREIAERLPIVRTLSLDEPDEVWVRTAMAILDGGAPARAEAKRQFEASPFTIAHAVDEYREVMNAIELARGSIAR